MGQGETVRIGCGPREVEEALLGEISAEIDAHRADPTLLARPLRVIVPSRSLRLHLAERIAARFGAIAGVSIATLHGAALEVLDAGEGSAPHGDPLLPLLVARHAAERGVLRTQLHDLTDGYRPVTDSVRDLLDAGLDAWQADAATEAVEAADAPRAVAELARAVVEVAGRCLESFVSGWPRHGALAFARAREILEARGAAVLPARRIWIHGINDATGVAADFVQSLQRTAGATVFLDRPPAPGRRGRSDPTLGFGERLRERAGVAGESVGTPEQDAPAPALFDAPSPTAEMREVARRVARLLRDGARPESVAIVARDWRRYVVPLRLHFERLGLPMSGLSTVGPARPERRTIDGFLELLQARPRAATDAWLDARLDLPTTQRNDLRLGLRHLSAAHIGEVASLGDRIALDRPLALPVRRGFARPDEEETDDAAEEVARPVEDRRQLPAEVLREEVGRACALVADLEAWPESAAWRLHVERARALLFDHLGWTTDEPACRELLGALEGLGAELPSDLELERDEAARLIADALKSAGSDRLGGSGGGVQILSVMEARARTSEHLFVVGLNRDVFPRVVREDPLLPDPVRFGLRAVLPDLSLKRDGVEEERFLFAQLLASSDDVTLSWALCDARGQKLARSTLLDRLGWGMPGLEIELAPQVMELPRDVGEESDAEQSLRPAFEWARIAALARHPAADPLWVEAIREASGGRGGDRVAEPVAAVRRAIVRELDRGRSGSLGPYLGWVGPASDDADPRNRALWVTGLEAIARCPWQAFLERILGVEGVPDPLESLPAIDPLILGNAFHAVLERIVGEAAGVGRGDVSELSARVGSVVRWPEADARDGLIREESRRVLASEGVRAEVLVEALALATRTLVDRALVLEGTVPRHVLSVEPSGWIPIGSEGQEERRLHFRADRADGTDEGLILTDYKSGRAPEKDKGEEKQREKLARHIASGERIQAAVYARACGVASGRYLFAGEDREGANPERIVDLAQDDLSASLDRALEDLVAARDAGAFVPRLLAQDRSKTYEKCKRCEVAEACLHHDSSAHRRLRDWIARCEELEPDEADLSQVERAAIGLLSRQAQSVEK